MNPRTLTATWLREPRAINGVVPLDAEVCAMLADALEIADVSAVDIIWSECPKLDGQYLDISYADPIALDILRQAVRYLEARGRIERAAGRPYLVRVVDAPRIEA